MARTKTEWRPSARFVPMHRKSKLPSKISKTRRSTPNRIFNTEIAVLNKINAASVIALRNSQDTNKLLTAVAEQQFIQAKRQRDSEAQAVNNHISFMANEQN